MLDIGYKIGRLSVVSTANSRIVGNRKRTFYTCQCECGNIQEFNQDHLVSNRSGSRSCRDCFRKDISKRVRTHGERLTRLFNIWSQMRKRCKPGSNYKGYSDRGITVCEEWNTYISFRDWAISNNYSETTTIDRIDNNGNYEPSNCRWVNMTIQANNKSNNRLITAFGEEKTLADWYKDSRCSIDYKNLHWRIQSNWPVELAITTPKQENGYKWIVKD